jgi:NAD(P)-dependent dehydrogenase (short-subunit alcohol dehydrogenase family)
MRQAALELSVHRIRANAVAPGIVMAGLAKVQFETEPQYAARASKSIPLGAPQTAEQIGEAVGERQVFRVDVLRRHRPGS